MEQKGIKLNSLKRKVSEDSIVYETISCNFNRNNRTAEINIKGPVEKDIVNVNDIIEKGSDFWTLKFVRELDDLILMLRTNELNGVVTIRSKGSISIIQDISNMLAANQENWFINEILGFMRRTFSSRLDISSKTIFTIVDNDSCLLVFYLISFFVQIEATCLITPF